MADFSSYHLKGQHFKMNKGYLFSSLLCFFNLRQGLTMQSCFGLELGMGSFSNILVSWK